MARVPDVLLDLYDEVPIDCYVSGVPFALRGFFDNEVIPSLEAVTGPDGVLCKWIRFCDYLPFVDGCEAYWMESQEYPLYVYVMPYTPLRDAYHLHEKLDDVDPLPLDASVTGDVEYQEFQSGAVTPKKGTVEVANGFQFTFFVVNYKLLHSKAKKFRLLSYISDPLVESMHIINVCADVLRASTPTSTPEQLEFAVDDAKRRLAITLLEQYGENIKGIDPHDALKTMYPERHDEVYQDLCWHCHPHLYPAEQEDTPEIRSRLNMVLQDLSFEDQCIDDSLPLRQAEFNLMSAEGSLEFQSCSKNGRDRFFSSTKSISTAINPTCDYIRVATTSHSLIGVLTRFEDGNPDNTEDVN